MAAVINEMINKLICELIYVLISELICVLICYFVFIRHRDAASSLVPIVAFVLG